MRYACWMTYKDQAGQWPSIFPFRPYVRLAGERYFLCPIDFTASDQADEFFYSPRPLRTPILQRG